MPLALILPRGIQGSMILNTKTSLLCVYLFNCTQSGRVILVILIQLALILPRINDTLVVCVCCVCMCPLCHVFFSTDFRSNTQQAAPSPRWEEDQTKKNNTRYKLLYIYSLAYRMKKAGLRCHGEQCDVRAYTTCMYIKHT